MGTKDNKRRYKKTSQCVCLCVCLQGGGWSVFVGSHGSKQTKWIKDAFNLKICVILQKKNLMIRTEINELISERHLRGFKQSDHGLF